MTSVLVIQAYGLADIEGLTEYRRQHAPKPGHRLGVRGSGCPGADDLANRRQVQTYHAIFEKADALTVQQLRRHGTYRRE